MYIRHTRARSVAGPRMAMSFLIGMAAVFAAAREADGAPCLALSRGVSPNAYVPGSTLEITLVLQSACTRTVVALGIQETLPQGWAFLSGRMTPHQGYTAPSPAQWPEPGTSGTLDFYWIHPPEFPFALSYTVMIPPTASGTAVFSGQAIFFFDQGGEQRSERVETSVPPAGGTEGESPPEGEGESPGEGEGEMSGEGEGEAATPPKTRRILFCGGGPAPDADIFGDAACLAASALLLSLFSRQRRRQGTG